MNRLRERLTVATSGDDGFTLSELLVGIVILGVVGAMLSNWFIAGVKSTMATVGRNDDVFASRNALELLTRDIQLAVPKPNLAEDELAGVFVSGAHDRISMYTMINGNVNPSLVSWTVTGHGTYDASLSRNIKAPAVNASTGVVTWPGAGTTKVMLQGLNDKDDGKIPDVFRFLDSTGAARPVLCADVKPTPTAAVCASTYAVPLTSDPLSASSPSLKSTDDVVKAKAVEIYLQVASAGDGEASTKAPYFETSKKTGNPLVVRTRVYPLVNTVNTTNTP